MNMVSATAVVALVVGLGYAVIGAAAMPDVHVSYSTDACVKVINYGDTNWSCENLPKRFNHVWVQ